MNSSIDVVFKQLLNKQMLNKHKLTVLTVSV